MNSNPPKLAEKLLGWFLKEELAEEVQGDLEEKFFITAQKHNTIKAKWNYWYQVINYLRPFAFKSTKVKNLILAPMKIHFKYTARLFKKNSLITIASFVSIVLGVLSSFLIYLWADAELTTDKFHANYKNLFIPGVQQSAIDNFSPINTGLFFDTDYTKYAEIDNAIQAIYLNPDRLKFEYENTKYEANGLITDSTFFDVFDFQLLVGDPENILHDPKNIILTESLATQVFGDADPLGKVIKLDQSYTYQVAGILKDVPSNSSFTFDYVAPSHSKEFWPSSGIEFLVTNSSFNIDDFNEKIKNIAQNHPQFKQSTTSVVPFSEVYFDLKLDQPIFSNQGDIADVQTMIIVAIVILLVSILNFTNMQSTLMLSQIKNKSIKRVHGARRGDFFLELLVSRFIYFFFSIIIIVGIFNLVKNSYLSFLELTLSKSLTENILLITTGCVLFLIVSTLISLLQASTASGQNILFANKSNKEKIFGGSFLTTLQYVFAIVLIVASGVVYKQFKYMQNKDLGFDPQNLVTVKFLEGVNFNGDMEQFSKESEALRENYQYLNGELTNIPGIENYSQGEVPLSRSIYAMPWRLAKSDFEYSDVNLITVDPRYTDLLSIDMVEGRFFSDSLDVQRQNKVVINKAAMEYWGIEKLDDIYLASSSWGDEDDPFRVIGITEDFNYEHLSRKVKPLIMVFHEDPEREYSLRISGARFKQTIEEVASLYNVLYPSRTFTYEVLENQIQSQYDQEKKLAQTFMLFTFVALLLSSLGLFTFALYDTQKRIKEIGIRKVIGASTHQVISLLSSSFMKWVILAFIIALPLSWYAMKEWISSFANQTELSWWIFAGAGVITVVLALITVIGQSYKAANNNPVQALRHE